MRTSDVYYAPAVVNKLTHDRAKRYGIGQEEFEVFKVVESLQINGVLRAADFSVEYIRRQRGNGEHYRLIQFGRIVRGAFPTDAGKHIEAAQLALTRFLFVRGVRRRHMSVNNTTPVLLTLISDHGRVRELWDRSVLVDYEDPEIIRDMHRRVMVESAGH